MHKGFALVILLTFLLQPIAFAEENTETSFITPPVTEENQVAEENPDDKTACPEPPASYFCPGIVETKTDEKGCIVSYDCRKSDQPSKCGNGICEPGEDDCHDDCQIPAKPEEFCPVSKACPDQSTAPCYKTEYGCECKECPIDKANIPPGCWQEKDSNGFVRVKCEEKQAKCPEFTQEMKLKCVDNGGTPRFFKDNAGCEIFNCGFGHEQVSVIGYQKRECLGDEQAKEVIRKCESLGLRTVFSSEGGCNVPQCAEKMQPDKKCRQIAENERKDIESKCANENMMVVKDFINGCPVLRCGSSDNCPRDPPPEAFSKCAESKGELVVQRNPNGCMKFSECIQRGYKEQSFVERPDEIPESTELLAIAFRLESLRIELDKLADKTHEIANYYESKNSPDKERYIRVSDMFRASVSKVDEIRNKLRERVDAISFDSLMEIKQDIKYIKDVMIKDILYLMLSSSSELGEITSKSSSDCGTDGSCFDNAFRICKTVTFYPEGRGKVKVTIKGLEDNTCIMHAALPESEGPPPGVLPGINPPYEMTCKIRDYALGVKSPEEDIFPYCEGNMVTLVKQFGTGAPKQAPSQPAQRISERQPDNVKAACVGCLDNGVCDAGECSECKDCIRGG